MANTHWYVARKVVNTGADTKPALEAMGFGFTERKDAFFYEVTPPKGWIERDDGQYRKSFVDEKGEERFSQFAKMTIYDREAHLFL